MGPHGDNVFLIIAWAVGGFFLSLLILVGLFGGLLLGLLLALLVPLVALASLAAEALKRKPAKGAAEEATIEEMTVLAQAEAVVEAAPTPVAATIVDKEGKCPIAPCEIGETWTMNGKWTGPESLCFFGERLLSKKAEELRSGDIPDGELFECQGRDFRIVFQIQKDEEVDSMIPA